VRQTQGQQIVLLNSDASSFSVLDAAMKDCDAIKRGGDSNGVRCVNGNSGNTNEITIMRVVSLRLAVGVLGERHVAGWWPSGFMSPTSTAFLTPVFGPKVLEARYQGVLESARRVHDQHIGVGRAFHPFRLPEVMEQRLFDTIRSASQELAETISSPDGARTTLKGLSGREAVAKSGPALLGTAALLHEPEWVDEAASLYSAAFGAGVLCFPYFTRSR
jgi:hypothetical protein